MTRMSVTDAVRVRHPEKAWREPVATPRKPQWIRAKAPGSPDYQATRKLVRKAGLTTVCEEAACPNIGECWSKKHVTVMILGEICTRGCTFCNVTTGKPGPVDPGEPERLAAAIRDLELNHVVITSVDRDDLDDGGAGHFVTCIEHVRRTSPTTSIEILTPDFLRKPGAVERIVEARPDVFNHNLETVPRLYREVRPGSRYFTSLNLLWRVKELDTGIFTKSGLMVGLGETREEVLQVMDDMRQADVDFLTVGQYLQPTPRHHPIDRFWTPSEFEELAKIAWAKGFLMVSASPLTRSSHHADRDFRAMQARRQAIGR